MHHLRELLGVIEQAPDDPKQAWAVRMDTFLRELHAIVEQARACGRDRLEPGELAGHEADYEQIQTTQIYLHADLAIKQKALDRTTPPDAKPGRYQPTDLILAFLDAL